MPKSWKLLRGAYSVSFGGEAAAVDNDSLEELNICRALELVNGIILHEPQIGQHLLWFVCRQTEYIKPGMIRKSHKISSTPIDPLVFNFGLP